MDDNETINNEKDVFTDSNISNSEKWIAGILLIMLTIGCGILIVGLWPDRIPEEKENIKPLYTFKLGQVMLVDSLCIKKDTIFFYPSGLKSKYAQNPKKKADTTLENKPTNINISANQKSSYQTKLILKIKVDTLNDSTYVVSCPKYYSWSIENILIHLNSLMMILVALCGFLGNMVFLSTSFTTYVGARSFKRSWLMWYCVKPFTAAALAMGVYFAFRGTDSTLYNINLYFTMTIAFLTGLFSNRATDKLRELFEVLFRPKEMQIDKLDSEVPEITELSPKSVERGKAVEFVIKGNHLPVNDKLTVTIEDKPFDIIEKKPKQLIVNFTLDKEFSKEKIKVRIIIDGVAFYEYNVDVSKPKQQEKEDVPTTP